MKKTLLTFLSVLSAAIIIFAQPSISSLQPSYEVNAPMTFNYTGGPGNTTDWIGVYPVNIVPDGDPASSTWDYITAPSGTFILNGQNQGAVLAAGEYAVHLFCCDGYGVLASDTFSITGEAPASISTTSYPFKNDSVYFDYSGGTGSPKDWIGIYAPGATPGADQSLVFVYVPAESGIMSVDIEGLAPGNYDAHLLCCDGYDILATTSFTIYESTAPKLDPTSTIKQNEPITFNFGGGTGSFLDWIGIYNAGDIPGSGAGQSPSISFSYVNGPNGQLLLDTIPEIVPGKFYDAHLFCCDVYDIIASYKNFSVSSSATKDVKNVNIFSAISYNNGIEIHFKELTNGVVNILNTQGQIITSAEVSGEEILNFNGLISGNYIIQLLARSKQQVDKISVK
jgi:hypothetical protein